MTNARRLASFLFVVSLSPKSHVKASANIQTGEELVKNASCPSYGCPLLPRDINFDEKAKAALKTIRDMRRTNREGEETSEQSEEDRREDQKNAHRELETSGGDDMATLTLVGYKGGRVEDQINQDRAFILAPYYVGSGDEDPVNNGKDGKGVDDWHMNGRFLGVFDGHAKLGEVVAEFARTELPMILKTKLEGALKGIADDSPQDKTEDAVRKAFVETFVQIDSEIPTKGQGGCTASVVLQLGSKVYVANAGDSRSFVATHVKATNTTKVIYSTREDKPHLPDEKERIEKMGGSIYIPPPHVEGDSSRVIWTDPSTGLQSGLAMSRSIGDWGHGKVGVIPDPIVEVIDVRDLLPEDISCDESSESETCSALDSVDVFAVSATDGMMDYFEPLQIAEFLATSLYGKDGPHLLSGCERLIVSAAKGWYMDMGQSYRDDIAIAASKLSLNSI